MRLIDEGKYSSPHIYLASDGVSDLWEYDEIAERLTKAFENEKKKPKSKTKTAAKKKGKK